MFCCFYRYSGLGFKSSSYYSSVNHSAEGLDDNRQQNKNHEHLNGTTDDQDNTKVNNELDYKIRKLSTLRRVVSIPGRVQKNELSFDELSDLDIDKVELVPDSDDSWSIQTPSLPPLSPASSEESFELPPSSVDDSSLQPIPRKLRFSHFQGKTL